MKTISDLPNDLESEILSRVPAKVLDDSFPPLGYSVNRNGVYKVNDAFLITKFDFTTETLVRLPLPFQNLHPWDKAFLSVVRDEKIALLHVLETERVDEDIGDQ
ncbi:BnaC04g01020D [Brassica napus]|uniref:BnaC04g01020D protein n=1 Tax=Brassica napus TaxID=3708 RepID=A0A078HXG5_BRANA|nr:BnaC04g01020D [Brassica napus]